jgi:hypothetical protein
VPACAGLKVDDDFFHRVSGDELVAGVTGQLRGLAQLSDRQQQEREGRADDREQVAGHDHANSHPAPHFMASEPRLTDAYALDDIRR